LISCTRNS